MADLHGIDLAVIALYFVAVFAIGFWAARRKEDESADYFLAGRDVGWLAVGASLFASNIGSEHLVGLAGTGAASGLAVGHFEWLAALVLLLLGWFFVPFYLRSGVYTMPEFLELRYNAAARWYLTTISVAGYVLTKISVSLFAGGLIIQQLTGISLWVGAVVMVIATGLYTVAGGLRAVIYTDTMQMFVLVAGAVLLTAFGLVEVGGWGALWQSVPPDFYSIWKPSDHPDFPWSGILLGAPILGVWYWCTDQFIVQRVLAARNLDQARKGTIFAGFLKILPVFIFVLPGVIAAALYSDIGQGATDQAFPALVTRLLPVGVKGLVLAGLLAALMSSLSSVFNSASTLITWDVYRKLRPEASERRLVLVGRIATAVLVVLGLLWIPFMKYISSQLYIYMQSVQSYIAPPIVAVFVLGLLLPRLNGAGAVAALGTGLVAGGLRLGLELANGPARTGLADGTLWSWIAEVNFLHFAAGLFVVCSTVLVAVSYATPAPSARHMEALTYSPATVDVGAAPGSRRGALAASVVLVAVLAVLWVVFA